MHDPDLVILELGLPDLDGIEVCRLLRNLTENPILALSRDWSTDRKVRALDQGADDYITTPFSMPELLARIRVALRHRAVLTTVLHHHLVEVGELQIDVDAREVRVGQEPIELTRTEFDLLLLLARNPGKVLDHRTIVEHVWSARAQPSSTALRVHVANLRRKLGTGENRPELATETGVGYRLVAPQADAGTGVSCAAAPEARSDVQEAFRSGSKGVLERSPRGPARNLTFTSP